MTVGFTVYIDESGHEGFVFQPNERGSSRWLVPSAALQAVSEVLPIRVSQP